MSSGFWFIWSFTYAIGRLSKGFPRLYNADHLNALPSQNAGGTHGNEPLRGI
jgi:hypothetical protein